MDTPVELRDVHDTILALAGEPDAPRSLLRHVGDDPPPAGPIAAAVWPESGMARNLGGRYAQVLRLYREGREAVVIAGPHTELFDLEDDPRMRAYLVTQWPERARALRARADAHFGSEGEVAASERIRIDAQTTERLRSLGYVAD